MNSIRTFVTCLLVCLLATTSCYASVINVKADSIFEARTIDLVRQSALDTTDFYQKYFGVSLDKPVDIVLVSSQERFRNALIEVLHMSPYYAEKFAKHNRGVSSWHIVSYRITNKTSKFDVYSHISHEMTHTVQRQITGTGNAPGKMTWIWEGMANVIPAKLLEEKGVMTISDRRNGWITYARKQTFRPDLNLLFNQADWFKAMDLYGIDNVYNLATLAVEYLAQKKGYNAIVEYVRFAGKLPAEESFVNAFGMTIEEFRRDFGNYLIKILE